MILETLGGEAINRISCMGSNLLDADNEDE